MATTNHTTIRGVIGPDRGKFFHGRLDGGPLVSHAWFALSAWRTDGGSLEKGRLVAKLLDEDDAPTGEEWPFELWVGRLVEFDAYLDEEPTWKFDDGGMPWRITSISFDPTGDAQLDELASSVGETSPPTEQWHSRTIKLSIVAKGTQQTYEALLEVIGDPVESAFSKGRPIGSFTDSRQPYHHTTSHTRTGLTSGQPVFVEIGNWRKTGTIEVHGMRVGNAMLREFFDEVVLPAAAQVGLSFDIEQRPDVVLPDAQRRDPVPVGDIGMAIPGWGLQLPRDPHRDPQVVLGGFDFGPMPAPLFEGQLVSFGMGADEVHDPKVIDALIGFFTLSGDPLKDARTAIDKSAWKMVHKKRREFDPTDVAEIYDVWSKFTLLQGGSVNKDGIELQVHKHTKDWPSQLKMRGGVKVSKFS